MARHENDTVASDATPDGTVPEQHALVDDRFEMNPRQMRAALKFRVAEIDLEIANLQQEKARIRTSLAKP